MPATLFAASLWTRTWQNKTFEEQRRTMAGSATEKKPAETKEVKLNPPRPFVGKRTDLNRFLQDIFVYLMINKDHYDTDEKKIGFVLSF